MTRYILELDDFGTEKAKRVAAFFKTTVEALVAECAQDGLERKEEEMLKREADSGGAAPKRGGRGKKEGV